MEAIYRLKTDELNTNLLDTIKKLFKGQEIIITVSTEMDETTYLTMSQANKNHLLESIAQEPSVKFSPEEFKETIKKL